MLWAIRNWKLLLSASVALAVGFSAGYPVGKWRGFSDGVEHQKTEYLKSEHDALVKSTQAIAATFNEYERIISDINKTPDPSRAPALLLDTINKLPNPKNKTTK